MSEYKKSKYISLRREWKESKEEYNNINYLYEGIEKQFISNVLKFCHDNKLGNPFSESSSETQNVGGGEHSCSLKSLFRKIVVHTHPDKTGNNKHAREIYENAAIAKREGNLQDLLDVSNKVNIKPDINNFTLTELDLLQSNINQLKEKINKIKNSYPWVWFHSNESKRNLILKDFIECSCEHN